MATAVDTATDATPPAGGETGNDGPFESVRLNEKAVRAATTTPGPVGARVVLAALNDDRPTDEDLKLAGFIA